METPPIASKKSLVNSVTKTSLTPCRRLGLGRPSSGSLKKTQLVRTLVSSSDKHENIMSPRENKSVLTPTGTLLTCSDNRLPNPLTDIVVNRNATQKSRRRLTASSDLDIKTSSTPNISKKRRVNEENVDINSKTLTSLQKHNSSSSPVPLNSSDDLLHSDVSLSDSVKNVTTETIEQLALSIRKKKVRLEELKVQETYAKKHDLADLRQQTARWRTAGQDALRYSLNLAKQAGYSVTLKQLMSQHGFLPHLMGYNSEDDEFC